LWGILGSRLSPGGASEGDDPDDASPRPAKKTEEVG